MRAAARLLLMMLVLAACGQPADEDPGVPDDADAVTGTLAGDAQLEGGCVWLESDGSRYEVLWPEGYTAEADPVALRRDGEVVAEAGDQVTVRGEEATDVMTTCQVGTIFAAESVEVAGG